VADGRELLTLTLVLVTIVQWVGVITTVIRVAAIIALGVQMLDVTQSISQLISSTTPRCVASSGGIREVA